MRKYRVTIECVVLARTEDEASNKATSGEGWEGEQIEDLGECDADGDLLEGEEE